MSTTTATTNRLALVMAYRRHCASVNKIRLSMKLLADALDTAQESRGDAEADLAADLLAGGPIVHDGLRYEVQESDDADYVLTYPVDPELEDARCPNSTNS